MPPFPLRERLEFDRGHSMKHFLANAYHGIDFIATRDRSAVGGSRWSFKRCDQDDIAVTFVPYRLPLRPFFTNVFGQLDFKQHMDSSTISSSWLSMKSGAITYQPKDGSFYLSVPSAVWKDRAVRGEIFEADVSFSRFQREGQGGTTQNYSLRVHDIWRLSEHDLPMNDTAYECDLNPGLGMNSAYLDRYVHSGSDSLAFVKYPEHLVPTRDRASADGARYTFKDARLADTDPFQDPSVIWPTATARGRQKKFQCHLFGEISKVVELERQNSVAVELRCPVGITCAAGDLFREQLRVLRHLVDEDCQDATGTCAASWFGLDTDVQEGHSLSDTFWVYCVPDRAKKYSDLVLTLKAGLSIDLDVGFQRFDMASDDDVSLKLDDFVDSTQPTLSRCLLHKDFAPTRDRSDGKFDVFTYKFLETEVEATAYTRGELEPLWMTAFGEVESAERGSSAYIKFRCPKNVKCSVKQVYKQQIARLSDLLSEENSELGGGVVSSWFKDDATPEDDCFYISVDDIDPPEWYCEALSPGDLLVAWVGIQRKDCPRPTGDLGREYKLNALYFESVLANTVDGAAAEYKPLNANLTLTIMLARMLANGPATVALAEYDKDFVAIRQASIDGGSLFAFKAMPERDQGDDYGTKASLRTYVGSVFGEVANIYTVSDGLCILQFKLPSNATCALTELWDKQWGVLGSILSQDEAFTCGNVGSSFFDYSAVFPSMFPAPGSFYVRAQWSHGMRRRLTSNKFVIARVAFLRFHNDGDGGGHGKGGIITWSCAGSRRNESVTSLPGDPPIHATTMSEWTAGFAPVRGPHFIAFPSTSMLRKIRDDPAGSLALAKYQEDFVAVRRQSEGKECVFSFQDCRDMLLNPDSDRRWAQPRHSSLAYGEIKKVYRMREEGKFCILLTCPTNGTCDAMDMFQKQLRSLKKILDMDKLEMVPVFILLLRIVARSDAEYSQGTSWCRGLTAFRRTRACASGRVLLCADTPWEANEYEDMFFRNDPVGKLLECRLWIKRSQASVGEVIEKAYEINVFASTLHREDCGCVPEKGANYVCDMPEGSTCRMALGAVEYGVDFAAIREGSYPGGSEFYFAEDERLSTMSDIQGGLGLRINIVVGEIEKISGVATCSLGPACDVLCVKIKPPSNSNCEGYGAYFMQLEQLRKILNVDFDNGATRPVGVSWFDASREFEGWGPQKDCFYVRIILVSRAVTYFPQVFVRDTMDDRTDRLVSLQPGTCVAFCGTMSRLDEEMDNTRNYFIWALEFLPGEFPRPCEAGVCGLTMTKATRPSNEPRLILPSPPFTMPPLLGKIRTMGRGALAFALYEKDFFATRDSSCGDHEFHTFKGLDEWWDAGERRKESPRFSPFLFGEIRDVYEVLTRLGGRPDWNITGMPQICDLQRTRDIYETDLIFGEHFEQGQPGEVVSSWFDGVLAGNGPIETIQVSCYAPSPKHMELLRDHYMTADCRGQLLSCTAMLDRSNCLLDGEIKKAYEMWAVRLDIQKPEALARVSSEYTCDFYPDGTCSFCVEGR
ncbi:hypothetical protein C8F04DRAFT_1181091 [Mycena alexandri]|uniref:Uncharacterized protein n=1 Tax=Mycena alexandri TaxID=1745969 RepID=A0AAD6T1F5_9AGAR|nr:hypothetical protein C8F04DRAFT_1181091 [Mycena alexandri]